MHACVHVCVRAYVCVCTYMCVRMHASACVRVCMHACVHVCMHAYLCVCVFSHKSQGQCVSLHGACALLRTDDMSARLEKEGGGTLSLSHTHTHKHTLTHARAHWLILMC